MILPAYKAALGGQLKNRPGPARASASFSPGFHPGSAHTRDVPINQYEISNQKSEISCPPLLHQGQIFDFGYAGVANFSCNTGLLALEFTQSLSPRAPPLTRSRGMYAYLLFCRGGRGCKRKECFVRFTHPCGGGTFIQQPRICL